MGLDTLFVFLVLTSIVLLGSSLLNSSIRVVALQGAVLSFLPLLVMEPTWAGRAVFLAALTMGIKGIVFPVLLLRSLREANVRREMQPLVGYSLSLALGIALLVLAFWLAGRLHGIGVGISALSLTAAFFMMFTGLFLIIARRKALTQVLGFLTLENGIYAFGLTGVGHIHWLVELGVLLDVFVAVFIMGIAIDHISREFDHINVDELDQLKG
ncbi:MAG: hydrogenase [Kiritimatiellae bacterium]|nr:hydrogenase [Kiritimatiellia bacterium]